MSAPVASAAQLLPTIQRALRKGRVDHGVVLVRADPDPERIPQLRLGAGAVTVRASRSPLEIRALVHGHHHGETLVVLTDCDRHDLGEDLLARVAGRDVFPLDRWQSVKDLFGARDISADLARKRHLADALIEARPLDGYPPVRSRVIDTDTALAALQHAYLHISPDLTSLADLLRWALQPEATGRLNRANGEVLTDLRGFLAERFGPGADALLAIVQRGKGADLVPLALAAGLVHDPGAGPRETAMVHLQYQLPGAQVSVDAWRELAAAAAAHLRTVAEPAELHAWCARTEVLLAELGAPDLAVLSDELPTGFEQRLAAAGRALAAWDGEPGDLALANAAADAIERAAAHHRANEERISRLRMAARLIRRGPAALAWGDRLADAARTYHRDGAWLDWARLVVSRRETEPTLAELYRQLTDRFDASRHEDNRRFAPIGATAAQPLDPPLIGLERVLDELVGPLAGVSPVLLIVLDGMSWPSWVEISGALAAYGWSPYRKADGSIDRAAVAVLPTVTEVSRTSLLCGRLHRGDQESEKRHFPEHDALRHGALPPMVEHKAQLRAGGLDSVPDALLAAIANPAQRVVAMVLNNIDERLKDVTQPPQGWGVPELDPLRWVLDAARKAGRPVIFTADHGHVLERDGRQITGGRGGERWRNADADRPAGDGEIIVHGPRVLADGNRAILPWQEQLRYTSRHNGYHGGITPQELFVPLAVLAAEDAVLPGWEPVAVAPPAWWHHVRTPAPVLAPIEVAPSSPKRKPAPNEPTLFELEPVDTASAPAPTSAAVPLAPTGPAAWAAEVTAALAPLRTARTKLTEDQITKLLGILVAHDGQAITEDRLADLAELPAARIGRYLSQLQELVNIDSYGVLTIVGREVRFDRALLNRQLGRA